MSENERLYKDLSINRHRLHEFGAAYGVQVWYSSHKVAIPVYFDFCKIILMDNNVSLKATHYFIFFQFSNVDFYTLNHPP